MELASAAGGVGLWLAVAVGGSLGGVCAGAALTLGSGVEGAGIGGAEAIAPAELASVLGDDGVAGKAGTLLVLAGVSAFIVELVLDVSTVLLLIAALGAGDFTAGELFGAFAIFGAGALSGAGAAARAGAGALTTSALAFVAGVSPTAGADVVASGRVASATIAGCVCGAGIATVLSFRL